MASLSPASITIEDISWVDFLSQWTGGPTSEVSLDYNDRKTTLHIVGRNTKGSSVAVNVRLSLHDVAYLAGFLHQIVDAHSADVTTAEVALAGKS